MDNKNSNDYKDRLVNELVTAYKIIADLRAALAQKKELENLVKVIFDSTRLSYNHDNLILRDDERIVNYVRLIDPERYRSRFNELIEESNKKNENKEAGENGK